MLLLLVLFHLKNFSRQRRPIFSNTVSNTLLPVRGSSLAEGAIFILGQPSSFTIRNQSTVGNGHGGTGKTLKPDGLHLSAQCTWHPEGPHKAGMCSKAEHIYCYILSNRVFCRPGTHTFLAQCYPSLPSVYLHNLLYMHCGSVFNQKKEREILIWAGEGQERRGKGEREDVLIQQISRE